MYYANKGPHQYISTCLCVCVCVLYLLVRRDGNSEHFDSMLPGFISSLLHASAWLFVTSDGMAISHHHDVLVLMVVGTPACSQTHKHTLGNDIPLLIT